MKRKWCLSIVGIKEKGERGWGDNRARVGGIKGGVGKIKSCLGKRIGKGTLGQQHMNEGSRESDLPTSRKGGFQDLQEDFCPRGGSGRLMPKKRQRSRIQKGRQKDRGKIHRRGHEGGGSVSI